MKSLLTTLMALVGICALGCGSASYRSASTAQTVSKSTVAAAHSTVTFVFARTLTGLRGDEEDDEFESKTEGTVPGGDADSDQDNDIADNADKGYYEKDDASVRDYGSAATATQRRALVAVIERYYRAGVSEEGAGACSLLIPAVARSAAEDYGHGAGPSYLRAARTCPEVVVGIFGHLRSELTGMIYVTAVRVKANNAYVLLGSRSAPASYVILERQSGFWRIVGLTPSPLP